MAKYEPGSITIADAYAETLLELSEAGGKSDLVLEQFTDLVGFIEGDEAFSLFLLNPAVDEDNRRQAMEKCFRGKLDDLLLNTLQVINAKGRNGLIGLILERYRFGLERVRQEVEVHVTSAVPIGAATRDRLIATATKVAGREAKLIEKVDPAILGGLVVRIGDRRLDSSVASKLINIREAFDIRASQEMHGGRVFYESA